MGFLGRLFGHKASPEAIQQCVAAAGAFARRPAEPPRGPFQNWPRGGETTLPFSPLAVCMCFRRSIPFRCPKPMPSPLPPSPGTWVTPTRRPPSRPRAASRPPARMASRPQGSHHKGIDGFLAWEAGPDQIRSDGVHRGLGRVQQSPKGPRCLTARGSERRQTVTPAARPTPP